MKGQILTDAQSAALSFFLYDRMLEEVENLEREIEASVESSRKERLQKRLHKANVLGVKLYEEIEAIDLETLTGG